MNTLEYDIKIYHLKVIKVYQLQKICLFPGEEIP
jgi:hypothetical protein